MGLDLAKLEKVKRRGSNTIARCPACAEAGSDRKGDHLFINDRDQFGCVLYPGEDGQQHRKRIFELAGIKERPNKYFEVKKSPSPLIAENSVIQKDILGHLGHIKSTHARKVIDEPPSKREFQKELLNSVPPVPENSRHLYSTAELEMLQGIDTDSLQRIDEVKRIFNGTVVAVKDNNCGANKEALQ
ncbi:MAG: hypothetical protein UV05_C0004G0005 [candidate division CPR1 bacterium GW2011_GWA2_42_17]|uniref:Uncharacterized protein n=1 Tax=candidate division CPR1 bacterium GW2011_GWA2_42_17 TaxID=1618341 RepID=A0A0G0Z7A9_9BACT|nr:MAG: hypothetical protein UV05_C0004G0005 [candidate division CPR1 bacterium GW2011_GWA2_42_17]